MKVRAPSGPSEVPPPNARTNDDHRRVLGDVGRLGPNAADLDADAQDIPAVRPGWASVASCGG